jgi:DNA-binding transcriptional ArsR family regulator
VPRRKVKGGSRKRPKATSTRRSDTKQLALRLLRERGALTSGDLAEAGGITRQAAHHHLARLVAVGTIRREGAGRGARYRLRAARVEIRRRRAGLDEARVWEDIERELPELGTVSRDVQTTLHYVVTELVNNAIDHSESKTVKVTLDLGTKRVSGEIVDDGIGIFAHVRDALNLASELEAIQELSKGKTTTDPDHHTGEGLFFSSKAVDWIELESGTKRWTIDNERDDFAVSNTSSRKGTRVYFELDRDSKRTLREVFDSYTDDFAFTRTRTVVRLFTLGVRFMSRSEARRLLHGLDRFREVVLDFAGVEAVGQGFADEIFRVWARAHRDVRLLPVNMDENADFMVRRALSAARDARADPMR